MIEEDMQPLDGQEHGWQADLGHHAIETFKLVPK